MNDYFSSVSRRRIGGMFLAWWVAAVLSAGPLDDLTGVLQRTSDSQMRLDILRGMSAGLKGLRSAPMPAGWESVEKQLIADSDAEVRTLARTVSMTFGSAAARQALQETVGDRTAPAGVRRAGLQSLIQARVAGLAPMLQPLLKDSDVAGLALRGLAIEEHPGTAAAILDAYAQLSPAEKRDALNTLASRATYARPLLSAVAASAISRADLTADLVRQLRSLKDDGLQKQFAEVWGVMRETSPDMQREIDRYRKTYQAGGSQPGDAPRGRAVFNRICAQCHQLFDTGGRVGPDITGANRSDLEYLLQNILYPNAVIPNEYRAFSVEMKDERVMTGLVREQTPAMVVVQTANEVLTLDRREIRKLEPSDISMMPEGLVSNLSETEFRDLIYYLTRPGQVPLPK